MHKRSRLHNRYVQVIKEVAYSFKRIVEIDIITNRYKVHNLVKKLSLAMLERVRDNQGSKNDRTKWLFDTTEIGKLLQSGKCYAVVDRSFFPDNIEVILAY